MVIAFALCLAAGSATVGRDGPEATAPVEPQRTFVLSEHGDFVLFSFPDRLANEPLPNLEYVPVRVRGTEGLAVNLAEPPTREANVVWIAGDSPMVTGEHPKWVVFWTEAGTAYSLSSDGRDLADLLRVAGSLR